MIRKFRITTPTQTKEFEVIGTFDTPISREIKQKALELSDGKMSIQDFKYEIERDTGYEEITVKPESFNFTLVYSFMYPSDEIGRYGTYELVTSAENLYRSQKEASEKLIKQTVDNLLAVGEKDLEMPEKHHFETVGPECWTDVLNQEPQKTESYLLFYLGEEEEDIQLPDGRTIHQVEVKIRKSDMYFIIPPYRTDGGDDLPF